MLAQGETFQFLQAEFLGGAVDGGVFEEIAVRPGVEDCGLDGSAATEVEGVVGVFEGEGVVTLVVEQAWVVVSFVEVLEDAGKDLWHSAQTSGYGINKEGDNARVCKTYSSGSATFFGAPSKNWPLRCVAKKGDKDRTSSWAANTR